MNWIQTFSGRKVDLEYPRPEDICIEDIAHALSQLCRFGGHCQGFYSVAEHSLLVEKVIDTALADFHALKLAALLHDAAEAYIGDLVTPLKKILVKETYLEGRWLDTIKKKFGLPLDLQPLPRQVVNADAFMLTIEVNALFPSVLPDWKFPKRPPESPEKYQPRCLPPALAETSFLTRFHELVGLL
jgi:hypothetical protein